MTSKYVNIEWRRKPSIVREKITSLPSFLLHHYIVKIGLHITIVIILRKFCGIISAEKSEIVLEWDDIRIFKMKIVHPYKQLLYLKESRNYRIYKTIQQLVWCHGAFSPLKLTTIWMRSVKYTYRNIFLIRLIASSPSSSEYRLAGLFLGRWSFTVGRDKACLWGGGLLIC